MSIILTQAEFDHCAAAWADTLQRASLYELQQLFGPAGKSRQAYVSFDLATSITSLLSTMSIAGVSVRFVLHKKHDTEGPARFGVVLCATDALGGRISAYYLNDPEVAEETAADAPKADDKPEATSGELPQALFDTAQADASDPQGQVPFDLIKTWINAWAHAPQLSAAMFQTHYGPLQGYDFKLSDFVDPLFQAPSFAQKSLRAIFDLKTYYPAYPENLAAPTQTFGLVLRLYSPTKPPQHLMEEVLGLLTELTLLAQDREKMERVIARVRAAGAGGSGSGGSSYDLSAPIPPGG